MHNTYATAFRYGADDTAELTDLEGRTIEVHSTQREYQHTIRVCTDAGEVAHLSVEQARVIRDALEDRIHTAESTPD